MFRYKTHGGTGFSLFVKLILALTAGLGRAATVPVPLMPLPAVVSQVDGELPVDSGFAVATSGYSDARLRSAVDRLITRLSRQTGLPLRMSRTSARRSAALLIE